MRTLVGISAGGLVLASVVVAVLSHQFGTSVSRAANLRTWAEQNPAEAGEMISIDQALGDKMKMTASQIAKACKLGECALK